MILSEIKMIVFIFQVTGFRSYVDLYVKNKVDEMGNTLNVVHEVINERWEVCLTMSEKGFQQVSFVNSIATTKVKVTVYYTLWSVPDLWPLSKNKWFSLVCWNIEFHMFILFCQMGFNYFFSCCSPAVFSGALVGLFFAAEYMFGCFPSHSVISKTYDIYPFNKILCLPSAT